ncbi:DUF3560 domain-containing protein, partial [Pseudomonas sp. LPH60]|uniref:DUF3560 domain-containing protein n=1 Tax=Pseudomonas sp. LPH60 TaxID=3065906 RepID=UPI00273C2083
RLAEVQRMALESALTNTSVANYQPIFDGFEAKGIEASEILPRVNVFTFNAWKALGRVVKKGERGVKIVTVIPCTKKDATTGEEVSVKKVKTTTVFHISQTEALDAEPISELTEVTLSLPVAEPAPLCVDVQVETVATIEAVERRPLNVYERKQQARRDRYECRAADAEAASVKTYRKAREMASVIPFGQPILVGHHSECRDRNYRDKIHNTFGKSFALQDRADHYAQKAKTVGTGGGSSDDPDAVIKLRAELESAELSQERMKAANKAIRSSKSDEAKTSALVALGFSDSDSRALLVPNIAGRVGFPDYAIRNNGANMRRIKGRIAELEKNAQRPSVEQKEVGFVYREDPEENRVMFIFDEKPDEKTRKLLKDHGFNWSPSRDGKPWIRKLNNAGIWSGQQLLKSLKHSDER